MPKILQINYKLISSVSSFMKDSNPVADAKPFGRLDPDLSGASVYQR